MAQDNRLPNTTSALLKSFGILGIFALIGLVGYVGWTIGRYMPDEASARQSRAPTTDNVADSKGSKAPTVVISKKVWDEVREDLAVLRQYSALIEYMKIFIPIFSFLLLSGLTATGFWFVDARLAKGQYESYKEANEKVDKAAKDLDVAQEGFKELKTQLGTELHQKLDFSLASIDHAISINFWHSGYLDDAIKHGVKALEHLDSALKAIAWTSPGSESEEKEKRALKMRRTSLESSIGYYYTERAHTQSMKSEDGRRAMGYARRLPKGIEEYDQSYVGNIVDNYFYILARSKQDLVGDDWTNAVSLFKKYNNYLEEIRNGPNSSADDKAVYLEYEKIFNEAKTHI